MEDVQGLFIGGLWLRRIGSLITACFAALAYFWGRKSVERTEALKRLIPKSLCIGTGAVFALSLIHIFVRVGAFAVSHAAMMQVVLMLAGAESGTPSIPVIVLGNLFVCGMEGLIVGIQVLRLEYYELFSRFYKGCLLYTSPRIREV